jgi:hypothetical protein
VYKTDPSELYLVERMLGSELAMTFSARNSVISPNGLKASKSYLLLVFLKTNTKHFSLIAGLIPQSLQLQAQVTLASLGSYHKSVEYTKSCARTSVCFCNQSGDGTSIRLLA